MSEKMSLPNRDTGTYELSPLAHRSSPPPITDHDPDSEPLLPVYSASPSTAKSPHQLHIQATRSRYHRLRRSLSCLCICLLVLVPTLGLLGCFFGENAVQRVKGWDRVPEEWRDWLGEIIAEKSKGKVDHGKFPVDIGYAGPTPTGAEPALLATAPAPPHHTAISPLVPPTSQQSSSSFQIAQHWGNLSPYFSVNTHGLSTDVSSLVPEGCEVERVVWLQRHGARYPTMGSEGPALLAKRLKETKGWKASGKLAFLNEWEYKLGAEVLTPFGRQQLFNLGVAARLKYGYLLDKMKGRMPVFRTESQDRMLRSAQNFATGFFGYPAEEQYNLEVQIEAPGFNCTLAPWNACRLSNSTMWAGVREKMHAWDEVFLADAAKRIGGMLEGYEVTVRDAKDLMEMCAYETVALGYSSFCDLFSKKEWRGFEYRNDLYWWYSSSFGYDLAPAHGVGWLQELVARLSKTKITEHNSTTNASFHSSSYFPLDDPLMVDFTHDSEFMLLFPTMNLTTFAEQGDLPTDKIPKHRSFVSSKLVPFATNMQVQVLSCPSRPAPSQLRIILNDAPVPLTGIRGCPEDEEGMCPVETAVDAWRDIIGGIDFGKACGGAYPVQPEQAPSSTAADDAEEENEGDAEGDGDEQGEGEEE